MKSKTGILIAIVLMCFGLVSVAQAGCKLNFTVSNGFSNVAINIEKISTAAYYHGVVPVSGLIYKKQWTGNVRIPVNGGYNFEFTVDKDCRWIDIGNKRYDNKWNVKVFRENGEKHICVGVLKNTKVTLKKPNECTK